MNDMTGFVARPARNAVPAEATVLSDGFWPDVDPAALRLTLRVTEQITPERWAEAIDAAIIGVGRDLADWTAAQRALGFDVVAAVPVPAHLPATQGGRNPLEFLYLRAVGCYARAEVTERLPDFDTTKAGRGDTADRSCLPDDFRRDGRHAIRDILGRPRTDIELI